MSFNERFIKLFSYINKDNELIEVKCKYGQKWSEITTDNETINSIFLSVDNGDGIIQANELNLLNKFVVGIDNLKMNTAGNEILEQEELKEFEKLMKKNKKKLEKFFSEKKKKQVWSESLDRNIKTITISQKTINEKHILDYIKNSYESVDEIPDYMAREYQSKITEIQNLKIELEHIAEEQGFMLQTVENDDIWIEDISIRRQDKKVYASLDSPRTDIDVSFVNEKGISSLDGGGRVFMFGSGFDVKIPLNEIYYGTSYLEGGNVLNTCKSDGTPSAIIGEASIGATLDGLGIKKIKHRKNDNTDTFQNSFSKAEYSKKDIEYAKEIIAKDLGLDVEQVTFIPQYDFHIDMLYHPLHNGEIAVPDFEEAISILENTSIPSMENVEEEAWSDEKDDYVKIVINKKEEIISCLKKCMEETKSIREDAEEKLTKDGYKLVKIPCFTFPFNRDYNSPNVNFMNGVGGTSEKTGQTFYITNKSEYPELENIVEKYFLKAGIDKVYFVSTVNYLKQMGGIDCLTQEK